MLSRLERFFGHRKVLRVRCADMNGIDCGIIQNFPVVRCDSWNREAFPQDAALYRDLHWTGPPIQLRPTGVRGR